MIHRDDVDHFLGKLYLFDQFEDHCHNGLQVEGRESIQKIALGVSLNMLLIEQAERLSADALIVHHGFFGRDFFALRGLRKKLVERLLRGQMSLFGIHLPMDAHRELGHNAILLSSIGASIGEPFDNGFIGNNPGQLTLMEMLDIFHHQLHPEEYSLNRKAPIGDIFGFSVINGFDVLGNGPESPRKLAIVSGESASHYLAAIEKGVDTFFCGELRERIPAISLETQTNFINLGHYFSEKPGLLALQQRLRQDFAIPVDFIDIPNPF